MYSYIIAIVLLFFVLGVIVFWARHPYYRKYKIGERVIIPGGATRWPSGEVIPDQYGTVTGKEINELFERGEGEKKSDSRFIPVKFDDEEDVSYVNKIFLRSLEKNK